MNKFRSYTFRNQKNLPYTNKGNYYICNKPLSKKLFYGVDQTTEPMKYGYTHSKKCLNMYIFQNI